MSPPRRVHKITGSRFTSNRAASLAGRTSPEAAACITAALEGAPDYAWMLDLSRAEE